MKYFNLSDDDMVDENIIQYRVRNTVYSLCIHFYTEVPVRTPASTLYLYRTVKFSTVQNTVRTVQYIIRI